MNDSACALLLASDWAVKEFGLPPKARVVGAAVAGVEPRVMGIGPVLATRKLLSLLKLTVDKMDVIEVNEAFAAQALAVLRVLGLPDDAPHVNRMGGAIALGHPLGASGARLYAALSSKKDDSALGITTGLEPSMCHAQSSKDYEYQPSDAG